MSFIVGPLGGSGGGGISSITIQTDAGTSPVGDTFDFTSSDGSVTITGDSGTDSIDFVVPLPDINDILPSQTGNGGKYLTTNGTAASWGTIDLSSYAPLASPAFTTSARFSFATASTVPYFDSNKDLISSAVTPTELGLLSGKTSLMSGAGTVSDNNIVIFSGTGGNTPKQFGLGVYTGYGNTAPYLTANNGHGFRLAGVDIFEATSGGTCYLSHSSAAHLKWLTDGGGDIGASAGTRPNNAYIKTNVRIGGNLGVGNSASASSLGTVVKKIEIFNAAGTSLGYIPIYDAIT